MEQTTKKIEKAMVETINKLIDGTQGIDKGEISDGYHTFNQLYDHRITLFIALCHTLNKMLDILQEQGHFVDEVLCWKSKRHSDGSQWPGCFIAGIAMVKQKQITYHIPEARWDELQVKELDQAPEYDGHTPDDVITRIKKLIY